MQQYGAAEEAFRRRSGGSASGAGLPGANLSPQASTGQQVMSSRANPQSSQPKSGQTNGKSAEVDPFTSMAIAGIKQLGQSAPGETETFLAALIQRLRGLKPQ